MIMFDQITFLFNSTVITFYTFTFQVCSVLCDDYVS